MENVYRLTDRIAQISAEYDEISARLEEAYIENGGEVTEDTEEMEKAKDDLARLSAEIRQEIIENADDYAAIAKNKEAQKRIIEAELKAVQEEQRKVVEKYRARIAGLDRSIDFWKHNFDVAMDAQGVSRIGGAKTGNKFTIYYGTYKGLEVEEDIVLKDYQERIDALQACLPTYVHVKVDINKTELKREPELPEGAKMVETRTIQIR